jgi:predicted membrane channel-forming protein YqfA (hemolysin III family)
MKDIEEIEYYSPIEEKINIISHATGFILSIVAFVLLVMRAPVPNAHYPQKGELTIFNSRQL